MDEIMDKGEIHCSEREEQSIKMEICELFYDSVHNCEDSHITALKEVLLDGLMDDDKIKIIEDFFNKINSHTKK